jgi:hypothetical protein
MLWIVTPCSRLENLNSIVLSLRYVFMPYKWLVILDRAPRDEGWTPPDWLNLGATVLDAEKPHSFGGHAHRNQALRHIQRYGGPRQQEWVVQLDDDTVIHHNFQKAFNSMSHRDSGIRPGVPGRNAADLPRKPLVIGEVDCGMFVVRADIALRFQWQESGPAIYNADGEIAERMYAACPEEVSVSDIPGSYWNALRPNEPASGKIPGVEYAMEGGVK